MTLNRILILDDDNDIRSIIRMSLEFAGNFDAVECCDGRNIVQMARETLPDLILLDVMMPDMDGPTVLAMLRTDDDTALIPVIFLTAKPQPSDARTLITQGAIGVLYKPFDPMTLSDQIQEIWDSYHSDKGETA